MGVHRLVRFCRLVVVGTLIASVAAFAVSDPPPVEAAGDPQAPVAQIALDAVVYDRYEPVVAELGVIGFFPSCIDGGVRDYIYPWADVYVVRGRPAVGKLTDVNGKPNAIAGFGGGGFFDEVLGYAGVNGLQAGSYSIVVDECQDGDLDSNDTVFPDIFSVRARASVDPMLGIGTLKAGAGQRAVSWERRGRAWKALLAMEKGLGFAAPFLTNPSLMAVGIGVAKYTSSKFKTTSVLGFPDPKNVAAVNLTNMGRHYRGIEADPPDPNYTQLTTLGPAVSTPQVYDGPTFAAAARLSEATATEEVLAAALLTSIERYQGAEAARDGSMALQHARQAQDFAAQLADHLRATAPNFIDAAVALETDPRPIDQLLSDVGGAVDDIFADGLTPEQVSFLAASGVSKAELAVELSQLEQLDLASLDIATIAANLRALSTGGLAYADVLDAFVISTQTNVDALEANVDVYDPSPSADAGGPYTATVGAAITFDAAASGPGARPISGYEWDLDGDGMFDDGDTAAVSFTPLVPRQGVVAVRVTGEDGSVAIDHAQFIVAGSDPATIVSSSPGDDHVVVLADSTATFDFQPSEGTVQWNIDGVDVATGTSLPYTPTSADLGVRYVTARVELGNSRGLARNWTVQVQAPDADGDGYPSNIDCDDTADDVYPGAPELLDGKDNDCNPASPDGGTAPTVEAGGVVAGREGDSVSLSGASYLTAGATTPITATVDWGDGAVASATTSPGAITAMHTYVEDGIYPIEVCATSSTGLTSCDRTTAEVANVAAAPKLATLANWTVEVLPGSGGSSNWVLAPDGLSVLQTNNSSPSFLVSDTPLVGTEASVSIGVETTSDDDYIGFGVGIGAGGVSSADARYLLIDWKQVTQRSACASVGGDVGLAVSLVEGVPTETELWNHADCDADPTRRVTELARATNLGSTGWANHGLNRFRFVYTTTRLQVYVDEVLEIDITSDLIAGDFPTDGALGFYNESQSSVRYSSFQISAVRGVEGTPVVLSAEFADAGTTDTHVGRFDYGDGEPVEAAEVTEADGAGTAVARHTYAQEGDYDAQTCLTDDDGGVSCEPVVVRIENAAPTVSVDADRSGGPSLTIGDAAFLDPGIADTHTSTIDWGDGGAAEAGVTVSVGGSGRVEGSHTYTASGVYTVTVCVTDDAGAEGCDTFAYTVAAENQVPTAEAGEAVEVPEGVVVETGIGFLDANPDDVQTVTVDWADGSGGSANVQQRPGLGSGSASHVYADNGVYAAEFSVCDPAGACALATSQVTVTNQPPVVELNVATNSSGGLDVALSAPFTDPGTADTHTATIDWGDGAANAVDALAVATSPVVGVHNYATAGDYTVEVCVTDDDRGVGCMSRSISITAQQTATTTSTTTTNPVEATAPPITVPPIPAVPGGRLPATGNSALAPTLALAALALAFGLLAVAAARRRSLRRW